MGKRSSFERRPQDFYPTPREAVIPLLPFVSDKTYAEPCCGKGDLISHLGRDLCGWASDIDDGEDAFNLTYEDVWELDLIITNPPWSRDVLHPLILHFSSLRPTWLLIDADWMHTRQSSEYMKLCSKIISIGRVKWIPESKMTGKDNCCWYLFEKDNKNATIFYGR